MVHRDIEGRINHNEDLAKCQGAPRKKVRLASKIRKREHTKIKNEVKMGLYIIKLKGTKSLKKLLQK